MWWISLALAAPPTDLVHSEPIGIGAVVHLEASSSGELLAFHTGSESAHLYDTETWTAASANAGCTVAGVALAGEDTLYAVCSGGAVVGWSWDGASLEPLSASSGDATLAEVPDASVVHLTWSSEAQRLFVVETAPGDFGQDLVLVHQVDPATGDVDGTTWPVTLGFDGFQTAANDGTRLFVSHGQDDITVITLATGALSASTLQFGGLSVLDLAPTNRGSVVSVGGQGVIAELSNATLQWVPWMYTLETGSRSVALAADAEAPWLLHAYDTTIDVWDAPGATTPSDDAPMSSIDVPTTVSRMVVGTEGYAYAGSDAGEIFVLTANPWVGDASVSPALVADGQSATVSFTVDVAGTWTVSLGGTRDGGGDELATGTAAAGDSVAVELTTDDRYAEGTNPLWIRHRTANGRTGHARVLLSVDNPPGAVTWGDAPLRFGNGSLVVGFEGLEDEDLDHYDLYISTEPFTAEEWPSGGPSYVGPDDVVSPIVIEAAPGVDISHRVTGLTNGTTYTVAVRAVDAGGLEGPMSETLDGMPRAGLNASGLAGDPGGPLCATGPAGGGAVGWLVGLFAVGLRRRRFAAGLAMLAALGLGASTAVAAEGEDEDEDDDGNEAFMELYHLFGEDQTRQRATFELRYGNMNFTDPAGYVPSVYNETNNDGLYLEVGPQLFQVLEFKAGVGFYQDTAWTIDPESGTRTADRTMMTWAPFSLSGTLRLHFFDEQPIVPFGTFGIDHLIWREKADDGQGGKSLVQGAYRGSHVAYGFNVLLDVLAPRRAGLLEAQSGVNDTWVVVEWRTRQQWERVGEETTAGGVDFAADVFTAGLKLDF